MLEWRIDASPGLRGAPPALMVGTAIIEGIPAAAMEQLVAELKKVADAWEEKEGEVAQAEGTVEELEGDNSRLIDENSKLLEENERLSNLLKKHGIEVKA